MGRATVRGPDRQISPPGRDPSSIDDLRKLKDSDLVALFAVARDGGVDPLRGKLAWETLVVRHYDRVRGLVETFRFPGHETVRIADADVEDATQEAFLRVLNKLRFRGASLGEFLKALRTTTYNSCMDFCRRTLARERHERGSMDEVREEPAAIDHDLAREAQYRHDDQRVGREDLDELLAALPSLPNENMRAVIVMSLDGAELPEIAAKLDTSPDNVYQLRSRALRKLRAAMQDA
jgi:RNA polymerase sigma factor (sigma-70 family)